mmetsp:Transcript_69715/g.187785  ORF Transcript_69715/g.187785 Transcript_69715/m.187785 type:complete len:218 (-) Transcript_69715:337-990(-)
MTSTEASVVPWTRSRLTSFQGPPAFGGGVGLGGGGGRGGCGGGAGSRRAAEQVAASRPRAGGVSGLLGERVGGGQGHWRIGPSSRLGSPGCWRRLRGGRGGRYAGSGQCFRRLAAPLHCPAELAPEHRVGCCHGWGRRGRCREPGVDCVRLRAAQGDGAGVLHDRRGPLRSRTRGRWRPRRAAPHAAGRELGGRAGARGCNISLRRCAEGGITSCWR